MSTAGSVTSAAEDTTPGNDDELTQLEEEVMNELRQTFPEPTPPPAAPAAAEHASAPEVTGSLAAGLGEGGLSLSDLYDEKVDDLVRARFDKMSEEEFQRELVKAPHHPEFQSYCNAVKLEIGLGDCSDDPWVFGEYDAFEDLVNLHIWATCRQQLRDRLALGQLVPAEQDHGAPTAAAPENTHPAALPAPEHPPALAPPPAPAATPPAQPTITPTPPTVFFLPGSSTPVPGPGAIPTPKPAATPTAQATPTPTPAAAKATPTPAPTPVASPTPPQPVAPTPPQPVAPTPQPVAPTPPQPVAPTPPQPVAPTPPQPVAPTPPHPVAPTPPQPVAPTPPQPVAPTPPQPVAPSDLSERVDSIVANVAAATLPTSTTHRSDYMAFLRAARNPGKMAKGLIPAFASGNQAERLDLFRLWLEKGKDFAQVEVEVNRRNIQSHTAKMKDMCMSRAQLEQDPRYKGKPQDIEDLIKRKTQSGDYIDDPNFPGREDLRQYIIHAETSKEDAHTRQDTQQINSRTTVSASEALSLTEEGADFSAAHPSIRDLATELGGAVGGATGAVGLGTDQGKGAKGKGGKGRRRKGKGEAAAEGGGTEPKDDPEPAKTLTPLAKAIALKGKVLLNIQLGQLFFSYGLR